MGIYEIVIFIFTLIISTVFICRSIKKSGIKTQDKIEKISDKIGNLSNKISDLKERLSFLEGLTVYTNIQARAEVVDPKPSNRRLAMIEYHRKKREKKELKNQVKKD